MASRASNRSGPKLDIMERRVPRNPKYENVEPVVDTGASMSRYMKKIEEIRQNYRIRKDELFKRMKVTTFIQLMIQVAEIDALEKDAHNGDSGDQSARSEPTVTNSGSTGTPRSTGDETSRSTGNDTTRTAGDDTTRDQPAHNEHEADAMSELMTTRSTLEGITRGVGEFDCRDGVKPAPAPAPIHAQEERPYLLLDVRTPDEYNQCHIITAESFPIAMLSRSVNYETRELLAYRNQPGKIIVLYDEDERLAPKAATTMVERGYDNLFLLSGGMKVAHKYFPQGLFTGPVPPTLSPPKNNNNNKKSLGAAPGHLGNDFTHNDLFILNQQLDEALDDTSHTSRLSRAATEASRSRVSQLTSRTTATTVSTTTSKRPPFR